METIYDPFSLLFLVSLWLLVNTSVSLHFTAEERKRFQFMCSHNALT